MRRLHTLPFILLTVILSAYACRPSVDSDKVSKANWHLAWRMLHSNMTDDHATASMQFDSLLARSTSIDPVYLKAGLHAKIKNKMLAQANDIVRKWTNIDHEECCTDSTLKALELCADYQPKPPSHPELQRMLLHRYADDQASRGNFLEDLIKKHGLDTSQLIYRQPIDVDLHNRQALQQILGRHGLPTRAMVGKDAMEAIFFIIQHADGDKVWQKDQLPLIEKAVKAGDLDAQSYAYLYDRIQVGAGLEQRYGTQFSHVDFAKQTTTMAPIEDSTHVDDRRRELHMMPLDMYRRLMLTHASR